MLDFYQKFNAKDLTFSIVRSIIKAEALKLFDSRIGDGRPGRVGVTPEVAIPYRAFQNARPLKGIITGIASGRRWPLR